MIDGTDLPASLIFFILLLVLLAAVFDLAQHRIPNSLVLWGVILALSVRYHYFGFAGLGYGLAGFSICLLAFLPLYICKGLGAGDVKLMAAVGAFLDPTQAIVALMLSLDAAALLGVGYLIVKGGVRAYLSRYWQMIKALFVCGRWIYIPPDAGEAAAQRFPFAVAIALGTVVLIAYYYPTFYANFFTNLTSG